MPLSLLSHLGANFWSWESSGLLSHFMFQGVLISTVARSNVVRIITRVTTKFLPLPPMAASGSYGVQRAPTTTPVLRAGIVSHERGSSVSMIRPSFYGSVDILSTNASLERICWGRVLDRKPKDFLSGSTLIRARIGFVHIWYEPDPD